MRAESNRSKSIAAIVAITSLAVGSLIIAAPAPSENGMKQQEASARSALPLRFGRSIPLAIQSSGVVWRGNTYHLVGLGSIQFDLDKQTSRLKAEIKAGVTSFDNVDYDVSAAVFDATGKLLGTARAKCGVRREWAGKVAMCAETVSLDFGISLDYANAATFMVSVSKRKVLTPSDWQK
jgi:hypothetical protein